MAITSDDAYLDGTSPYAVRSAHTRSLHSHTHGRWLGAWVRARNTAKRGSITDISYFAYLSDPFLFLCITANTLPWLYYKYSSGHYGCYSRSPLEALRTAIMTVVSLITPLLGLICLMCCFTVRHRRAPSPIALPSHGPTLFTITTIRV